jgi:hypothetical protein
MRKTVSSYTVSSAGFVIGSYRSRLPLRHSSLNGYTTALAVLNPSAARLLAKRADTCICEARHAPYNSLHHSIAKCALAGGLTG